MADLEPRLPGLRRSALFILSGQAFQPPDDVLVAQAHCRIGVGLLAVQVEPGQLRQVISDPARSVLALEPVAQIELNLAASAGRGVGDPCQCRYSRCHILGIPVVQGITLGRRFQQLTLNGPVKSGYGKLRHLLGAKASDDRNCTRQREVH
ncbi:hypothetical protein D3C81_1688860 [compost metagenome]